jgi:hypothetical protein
MAGTWHRETFANYISYSTNDQIHYQMYVDFFQSHLNPPILDRGRVELWRRGGRYELRYFTNVDPDSLFGTIDVFREILKDRHQRIIMMHTDQDQMEIITLAYQVRIAILLRQVK